MRKFLPLPKILIFIILVMPFSTHYQLPNYEFGSGGVDNATSANYAINGDSGEVTGDTGTSTTYSLLPGLNNTQQANVPPVAALSNPANYYDKLHLVISTGGNPSDTKYALAISTNNFSTTNYVKADHSVGSSLVLGDYQDYSSWGSGSGFDIIGLTPNTTYKVKVKAMQGKFTETQYGPTTSGVATVNPNITFSVSPNSLSLGSLSPGSIVTSGQNITTTLETNADLGGGVYISSQYGGLYSPSKGFTLTSASVDLSTQPQGIGAQIVSTSQTSGGPLNAQSPYNVSGSNVGALGTADQAIFLTTAPIVGGSGDILLKVKASGLTPSSTDYSDALTLVAAGNF